MGDIRPVESSKCARLRAGFLDEKLASVHCGVMGARGPLAALATALVVHAVWEYMLAKSTAPGRTDLRSFRAASRDTIAGYIEAAVRAGRLPVQDVQLVAVALLGALQVPLVHVCESRAPEHDVTMRETVQSLTVLALRAVGIKGLRARALVGRVMQSTRSLSEF